ncbi:MAG: ABC transporter ATP-binding protein [Acidobacteria bacterium]|nr:ABC transporter ATP-binding protein [Acidobacteriota bacterium]
MIRALSRLLPYIVRVRRSFLIGLACVPLATALSVASPWVLKYVVDGLTEGVERRQLALYAAALLALSLADGAFRYVMRTYLIGASRQIEYELRNDFFAHLERLPQAYFHAHRTGDLMSRATNDLAAVRMMAGPAVMYFTSTAFGFVAAVSVMCWIDVRLTLLALMPLPAVAIGTRYIGRAIHDRFEAIQAQLADMSAVVQEALAGVRVVKAYRQESAELARFSEANDAYVARNRGLIRLQAAFFPSLSLFFGLSAVALLWFGGRDVVTGRITLGDFVAFGRYLVLLSWPLISFGWVINIVQRGVASWERMLEVFDAEPESRPDEGRNVAPIRSGRIEARHLTFSYPGAAAPALEDVTFTVEPGRTVGIVGATGSGKSTLLSLLARWYDPPHGTLLLDDVDVLDRSLASVRGAIGMVPQEPFLFSDTLGGNVAFGTGAEWGDPELADRVRQAMDLAGLRDDLSGFPAGLETRVGERGITLSGGQRQRVAIARALLTDPRILVLDDALSAVDTGTEEKILRHLREIRRDRTCLIVAHRVSTVRDADEILVFSHGRIFERGTHDGLVAAGGVYAGMHQQQLLEQELSRV